MLMKRLFLVVNLSVIIFSCANKDATPDAPYAPAIPVGAEQEEYADTPGLVKIIVRDSDGKIGAFGLYRNKKRNGAWVEYQRNGLVRSMVTYADGTMEGAALEINENGQVAKQYNHHKDVLDGEYKEFNYSTLKEERFYKTGKLEGAVKIYYPDGKVMEEGNYKNGIRDGVSKWYDKDGNLSIEYEYKEGALIKK